jgi:hypothetical protein
VNAEELRWLRDQTARAGRSTWPADKNWAAALRMALDEIDRLRPLVLTLADEQATVSDGHGRRCMFCGAAYGPVDSESAMAHRTGCVKGLADAYAREQQV